jgi:hypothetical protein
MAELVAEKHRNPRERAKLASNVSKVIQNLRSRTESSNSAKTPTRGSQSPGLNYSSYEDSEDERGPNDTRSFNRSRRGSQHSQMSQMDVFQQGFGERDSPFEAIARPVPRRDSQLPIPVNSSAPPQPLQREGSRGQLQQSTSSQQGGGSRSASRLSYQELAKQAAQQPSSYQLPSAIDRGSPTNSARSGNSDGGRSNGSRGGGQPQRRPSQMHQQPSASQRSPAGNLPAARASTNSQRPALKQVAEQVVQQQQLERPQSGETGSPKLRRKSSASSKSTTGGTQQPQQESNPYADRLTSPSAGPQTKMLSSTFGAPAQSFEISEPSPMAGSKQYPGASSTSGSYNFAAMGQSYDADEPNQFRAPSRFERDSNETPANMQRGQSLLNSLGGPSRSASAFDPSWIDNSIQQTTFQGIEESEFVIRKRIWHAAMFRPKVWFQTNLLPQIRQEDLKALASKKRRMFIELAEPNFRLNIIQTANFKRTEIRIQFDEGLQREELEKATLLWRTQVKGAFDRLVDQLYVEMTRKQEDLRKVVQHDTAKAANATLDKTAFSFLHLHKMFGEGMLRRSKELYIYYFGIFASMNIKESKSRHVIGSEQNIERMLIELDRMRVFIAHVEKAEYENLVKYFQGEKRLLENEMRFKPKPMLRNTSVPAIKDPKPDLFSAKSATNAALYPTAGTPTDFGRARSLQQTPTAASSPVQMDYSPLAMGRAPSQQSTAQSSSRMDSATPLSFNDRRKETQSPFPLDALERNMPLRNTAAQQHAEMVDRELRATPLMRPGSTVNAASSGPKLPFQDSYLSGREMANQTVATASVAVAPSNPAVGGFYQQDAILQKKPTPLPDEVQYLSHQQVAGTSIQQSPASVIEKRVGAQAYDKLGRALQWQSGDRSLPAKKQPAMMTEDRRRCDDDELLMTQPARGGTVLPPLVESTGARKQREVSEGVISGLMLVSNVMAAAPSYLSEPDYAASRLPPIPSSTPVAAQTPAQHVVSSIGRMLLGPGAVPVAPSFAVPSENLEVSAVQSAETDTAIALLLMLHKNGADIIRADEVNVRKSLIFYAQEHRKDAVVAAGQNRVNKFYATRMERVLCEEAEARGDLYALQRHEFGLNIQRQQWVEYYLLCSEESSERESIVSMSHLSSAVLSKYRKQEFAVTSLMEHQALLKQHLLLYQRWFLAEVSLPTSFGLHISQNERRERNKILAVMDKEQKILEKEARGMGYRKEQYTIHRTSDKAVELEAVLQLEEIQRRHIARVFQETRARLVFDQWDEPANRMAIILGREKWFRELIRPTQFRMAIHTTEQDQRRQIFREAVAERSRVLRDGLLGTYELSYREMVAVEQREFRRLTMDHLKEKRQRESRMKERLEKHESMSKYIQSTIIAETRMGLGAFTGGVAAAPAPAATGTLGPDYTTASALRSSSRQQLGQQ